MRFWQWLFRRRSPRSARRSPDSPYRMVPSALPGAPPPEPPAATPPRTTSPPAARDRGADRSSASVLRMVLVAGGMIAARAFSADSTHADPPRFAPLPAADRMEPVQEWSPPSQLARPWTVDQSVLRDPSAAIKARWGVPVPHLQWNPAPDDSTTTAKPTPSATGATTRPLRSAPPAPR